MVWSKWMNKVKDWFDPEQGLELGEERENFLPRERNVSSFPLKEIDCRVEHVYPKAGAYRFPLEVESPKQQKQQKAPERERDQQREQQGTFSNLAPTVQQREKRLFQGTMRYFQEPPSPIYGYHGYQGSKKATVEDENVPPTEQLNKQPIEQVIEQPIKQVIEQPIEQPIEQAVEQPIGQVAQPVQKLQESLQSIPRTKEKQEEEKIIYLQGRFPERFREDSDQVVIKKSTYSYPILSHLKQASQSTVPGEEEWIENQAEILMETFEHFNLKAELIGITRGPTVTRFEVQPAPGIKISKFTNLQDDLKLSLAAKEIRMEAPIPGKHAIGIEVPNIHPKPVFLGDMIQSEQYQTAASPLTVCLGADIEGKPVVADIRSMPHGLIAGATGSGKSVCINSILVSLLYKATPEQLRLLLIDPKVVELSPYQSIPHLVTPVVTDPKKANASLKWAVEEMERRYQLFAEEGVRDIGRYNEVMQEATGSLYTLPYIVIIIDELADLMMVAPQDVEESICRITQKARACGIHLLVATQRPSVDVITGLIKANIPTRIAFTVSSQVDSRTILDSIGAEKLLGKGDMLLLANGSAKPYRLQGNYVSDLEIERVVEAVSKQEQTFLFSQEELLSSQQDAELEDDLIQEATTFVMEQGIASASSLQRKFRIGYNRAARMIDWMEEMGIVSESLGSKPRNVIWSPEQFENWVETEKQG